MYRGGCHSAHCSRCEKSPRSLIQPWLPNGTPVSATARAASAKLASSYINGRPTWVTTSTLNSSAAAMAMPGPSQACVLSAKHAIANDNDQHAPADTQCGLHRTGDLGLAHP